MSSAARPAARPSGVWHALHTQIGYFLQMLERMPLSAAPPSDAARTRAHASRAQVGYSLQMSGRVPERMPLSAALPSGAARTCAHAARPGGAQAGHTWQEVSQSLSVSLEMNDPLSPTIGLGRWHALSDVRQGSEPELEPEPDSVLPPSETEPGEPAEEGPLGRLPGDVVRHEIAKYLIDEPGAYFIARGWSNAIAGYLEAELGVKSCRERFLSSAIFLGVFRGEWRCWGYVLEMFPNLSSEIGDPWFHHLRDWATAECAVSCSRLHELIRLAHGARRSDCTLPSPHPDPGRLDLNERLHDLDKNHNDDLLTGLALDSWQLPQFSELSMRPPPGLLSAPCVLASKTPADAAQEELTRLVSSLKGLELPAEAITGEDIHGMLGAMLCAYEEEPYQEAPLAPELEDRLLAWARPRPQPPQISVETPAEAFEAEDMREVFKALMASSYFDGDDDDGGDADALWLPEARRPPPAQ